jgi:hypothetical protein
VAMQIGHREMPVKQASGKSKSDRVFGPRRKLTKMFRVGPYARVSTQDQQTRRCRESASKQGGDVE